METKTPTTVGTGAGVYQCDQTMHKDTKNPEITFYFISLISIVFYILILTQ
jgi:hypothetical protein